MLAVRHVHLAAKLSKMCKQDLHAGQVLVKQRFLAMTHLMPSPFSGMRECVCSFPATTSLCTACSLFCAITVCTAPCGETFVLGN